MWVLTNIDLFIFFIVIALATLPTVRFTYLTMDLIKAVINNRKNLNRWKIGKISLQDLHHLTPREFEFWCGDFIKKLGYMDVVYSPNGADGGKDIICKKFGDTAYIECKRFESSLSTPFKVDEQICKKLVGSMVHDGIKKGMIITTGIIDSSAIEYINTLPKGYELELLDGNDILRQYSYFWQFKYKTI
jgi:HJR/Mrr/RecB family endonuclease